MNIKIRLAVLDHDINYLNRLVSAFSVRYPDILEVYSFSEKTVALENVASAKIDVLLVHESIELEESALPQRCALGYFVESPGQYTYKGKPTVFKFQRIELIYKQILSIYAENGNILAGTSSDDSSCRVVAFTSASGGVGCSCMAAACAMYLASQGQRVLYIDYSLLGDSTHFFSGEGAYDMSDVIFAVKSRKPNIFLKLESFVKRDSSGVNFFTPVKIPLDMEMFSMDERMQLLNELRSGNAYEYIVIDMPFGLSDQSIKMFCAVHRIAMICNGSEVANIKLRKAAKSLSVIEESSDVSVISRVRLIYNCFSNKKSQSAAEVDFPVLGGAPPVASEKASDIIRELSKKSFWDHIFD